MKQPIRAILLFAFLAGFPGGQVSFSAYMQPHEHAETAPDVELQVLSTALRFYSPPRGQARWLEAERLPAAPDAIAAPLDRAAIDDLVLRLGAGRFCAAGARDLCRSQRGGGLRVSPVYRSGETARVAVSFESAQPHARPITSTQVFVLTRDASGWRIDQRALAAGSAP